MKMRLTRCCTVLAVLATGESGGNTLEEPDLGHTIRVALQAETLDRDRVGVTAFEHMVESLSINRVAVEVDDGDRFCGDAARCVAALQAGHIDVYQATVDDLAVVFPELQVLNVPYLFESDQVIERVFEGPFYARVQDAILERTGLRLMALSHGGGWRSIANTTRQVRHPDDVRGLTFGTVDSPVQLELTRTLGALPQVVPRARLSGELAAGVIQGGTVGILEIADLDPNRHLAHVTLDRHNYMMALWLMNEDTYQALHRDVQQIVRAGFDELRRLTFTFTPDHEAKALAAFEAGGGYVYTLTSDERREFIMAAGRVSTWFMATHGSEWLVWLEEAIAEAEQRGGRTP